MTTDSNAGVAATEGRTMVVHLELTEILISGVPGSIRRSGCQLFLSLTGSRTKESFEAFRARATAAAKAWGALIFWRFAECPCGTTPPEHRNVPRVCCLRAAFLNWSGWDRAQPRWNFVPRLGPGTLIPDPKLLVAPRAAALANSPGTSIASAGEDGPCCRQARFDCRASIATAI
jgi:hypothetical protein